MDERREVFYHRMRHMLAELEQFCADVASYNDAHPDKPPIEADPHGELVAARAWLTEMLAQEPYASFEKRT